VGVSWVVTRKDPKGFPKPSGSELRREVVSVPALGQ